MATGIEMLGQMGTDQSLAGPVQGGNMVVKPNQVPIGGAAMLSKALRKQADKGVGGMYVLPEQEESMPGFMQMAQQNVNEDMTRMARTVEAEAPPGHMLSYITPEEAGILKLLGGTGDINPVTGIPQFQPPGYDSSSDDPNFSGYGSSTSGGNVSVGYGEGQVDPGFAGALIAQEQAGGADQVDWSSQATQNAWNQGTQTAQQNIGESLTSLPGLGDFTWTPPGSGTGVTTEEVVEESTEVVEQQNTVNQKTEDLRKAQASGNPDAIKEAEEALGKEQNFLEKIMSKISSVKESLMSDDAKAEKTKDKKRIEELLEEAGGDPYSLPGSKRRELEKLQLKTGPMPSGIKTMMAGAGAIGDAFSKPKTEQFYDDNYLNILEKEILPGYGKDRKKALKAFANEYDDIIPATSVRPGDKSPSAHESLKQRLDNKGAIESGSDLEKRLKPVDYYRNNQPQTSGGLEDMVQNLTFADIQNSGLTKVEQRRLGARLTAARDSSQQDRQGGQRPGGMGGGAGPVIEDEVTEAIVEEGATTMPYTGPRTGGAEVNVPLSRRFALDPTQDVAQYKTAPRSTEDIYKYFTEGTTGEGRMLEPYGEFQKRRRKALGKEPLDFWSY